MHLFVYSFINMYQVGVSFYFSVTDSDMHVIVALFLSHKSATVFPSEYISAKQNWILQKQKLSELWPQYYVKRIVKLMFLLLEAFEIELTTHQETNWGWS